MRERGGRGGRRRGERQEHIKIFMKISTLLDEVPGSP